MKAPQPIEMYSHTNKHTDVSIQEAVPCVCVCVCVRACAQLTQREFLVAELIM